MGKKVLPIFKVVINPDDNNDTGVESIALVDKPAIESNFVAFSEDIKFNTDEIMKEITNIKVDFAKSSDEKRILTGALLIPGKEIYRNIDGYECLWVFDADVIEQVRDKYHRLHKTSNVNLSHQTSIEDCYTVESYIVNKDMGINPTFLGDEVIDGSWVISMKIDDIDLWNENKGNDYYKGFSIEGLVDLIETKNESTITYSAADYYNDLLKEYNETINTERC